MMIFALAAVVLLLVSVVAFVALLVILGVFVLVSLIRPSRDSLCETDPLVRPEALPKARTHRSSRSA
ncbi:MAG: hypothetical protein WC866_05795 [Patescibacteria group bacterium]